MSKLMSTAFSLALSVTACAPKGYGTGATTSMPPPLPAGSSGERWDHYCTNVGNLGQLLDQAGANGWEMVGFDGISFFCFKRRHLEAKPAAQAPASAATPAAAP